MKKSRHPNHGGRKPSPTYNSWRGMIQRCTNPNHKYYERYKGLVCEEWLEFDNFLRDMGERVIGTSLDRIDNEKGYCKENCRWATPSMQVRNRRSNSLNEGLAIEICELFKKGMSHTKIADTLNVHVSSVRNVLYRGDWL